MVVPSLMTTVTITRWEFAGIQAIIFFSGMLALLGAVFLVSLLFAPYRQRNELRKQLLAIPGATPESPRKALPELHFAEVKYHIDRDNPSQLNINVLAISTGTMVLENAKLEISGKHIPCTGWRTSDIWPGGTYSYGIHCEVPKGLSTGKHTIRLLIYANNEWWASDWDSIDYATA